MHPRVVRAERRTPSRPPAIRRAPAALVVLLGLALPARAQETSSLVPLDPEAPLALGTAWDRDEQRPMGEQDDCVGGGVDRHEGGPTTWSLLVLSRAGGRLLVGLHVARTVASEGLADARIADAPRRLAARDGEEFRTLCGDGFVAARALGGQYLGEIEIGPAQARAASARLRTGVWTDPAPFQASLEGLLAVRGAQARELPGGRRAEAVPLAPAELARRALAFPDSVTPEAARPFLARVQPYPAGAFAGTAIAIDPTLGWGDAARPVFLHDAGLLAGSAAAARAAEMRKAVVQRRGDARPPFGAPAGAPMAVRAAAPESDTAATAPAPPAGPPPLEVPAAVAQAAAPAASAAPVQSRHVAALVFEAGGGTPVFATTEPPPGVFSERVKQRVYWIPGVAVPTAEVREALARAAASAPTRGTTIVVAEVAGTGVVLTDVAPAPGVHAEPAGARRAWIAGVGEPTPAQREALAAAARGAD